MTQTELAKKLGISQTSVSLAEKWIRNVNERVPPNVRKMMKFKGKKFIEVKDD